MNAGKALQVSNGSIDAGLTGAVSNHGREVNQHALHLFENPLPNVGSYKLSGIIFVFL